MTWSPDQYLTFERERTRPVHDLLNALPPGPIHRAIDLGCGPGNSTDHLAQRFPTAHITGLDSSPDMIAAARQRLPHLDFRITDIATWNDPGPCDLILANAVLQWLPDHATLLPSLAKKLAPGGHLAIQMPDNLDEPPHRLMRRVANEGPWSTRLANAAAARAPLATPDQFYDLIRPQCSQIAIWRTIYHHPLPGGARAIVEWFKGSGLRPFLALLDEAEKADFLARYHVVIEQTFPPRSDGSVLLPFPRLFILGTR